MWLDGDAGLAEFTRLLGLLEAKRYEVGVLESRGRMFRRLWSARQACNAYRWMAARNGHGAHIYVRPAATNYVLVDDIDAAKMRRMADEGLAAAAVVETSPANLQVWIKFERELGREFATCVGKVLAKRYDGDLGSVDYRHFGRAAGFTNRKSKYARGGVYPPVRVVGGEGSLTGGAREVLLAAEFQLKRQRLARDEAEKIRRGQLEAALARSERAVTGGKGVAAARRSAREIYEAEVDRLAARFGHRLDGSRADAAACRKMAFEGFSAAEIAGVLAADEGVIARKPGHVEDYAMRTAAWATGQKLRRRR